MEGPLLHIPDNDDDNSQPILFAENYPMLDQGKMKYFAAITPITGQPQPYGKLQHQPELQYYVSSQTQPQHQPQPQPQLKCQPELQPQPQ